MSDIDPQQPDQPGQPSQPPLNRPETPQEGSQVSGGQSGWERPYAGRRAAYGPPAAESYPQAAYPPPAPPYSPQPYGQVPLHERNSGLALAGFITALGSVLLSLTFFFAFFGFLGSLTAVVLSIIGLVRDVNGRHMKGRGFALTGIIVGGITALLIVIVFLAIIAYAIAHPDGSSSCVGTPGYCDRYSNFGSNI